MEKETKSKKRDNPAGTSTKIDEESLAAIEPRNDHDQNKTIPPVIPPKIQDVNTKDESDQSENSIKKWFRNLFFSKS